MRRSELLGLPWEAVDLEKGVIAVRQALVASVTYDARLKEVNKTQAGRRAVAIDPETVAVLRDWRRQQAEESTAWGPAWEDSGLVFTREHGGWIHPETFSWWFDRHVKRLELPRITVHGLRHTHVTLGLLAGIDPKTMAQRVGHASIKFMYDTYAHLIPGQDEQAARIFSARVLRSQADQPRPAVSKPLAEGPETQ
jgi:integrase